VDNPHPKSRYRKLQGAGFSPFVNGWNGDDERRQGGHFSLEELALEGGYTITINYDFGHTKAFTIQVVSMESDKQVLPEVQLGCDNETRVKLVKKGNGKPHSQYARV